MTICVGLYSEARGRPGLALKGSGACWDCGLLGEWHSGRRCPAGRASGGCSMVNRPFMAGPQSLLSRANSSSPAWRDVCVCGGGGGAPWRGFLGLGVPFFHLCLPLSVSLSALQCSAGWRWCEGATHKQLCSVATTPKHWQSSQSAGKLQHNTGKHPQLMSPLKRLEAGITFWL